MNRFFLITLIFLSGLGAFAQEQSNVLYNKDIGGGLIFHTNGWGVDVYYGIHKSYKAAHIFDIQFVNMRHPKEVKLSNPFFDEAKSFVYGKKNAFTVLRLNYGQRVFPFMKERASGVSVGYAWGVGPSLGFAKPVYLEIVNNSGVLLSVEKYNENDHSIDDIFGRAGSFKGMDELKLYPGIFGKFAFIFEYSKRKEKVKNLEAGASIDVYFQEIPIMAFAENSQIFLNLYLAFTFGERFFK